MPDERKHYLCADCLAGLAPQRGPWPDNGEPQCCICHRPCNEGQYIQVYPSSLPCQGCGGIHEAAQAAQAQQALEPQGT